MSQKYVIVHFIELPKVPIEFSCKEWSLHVTLLANFTISHPLEKLIEALKLYALKSTSFEIMSDGEALFGPKKNVAVSLIQPSQSIKKIHDDLTTITAMMGAEYDEMQFMGKSYRPHATIQVSSRLNDKQIHTVNTLTLVDMYPESDIGRRRIIKTFELNSK